MILLPLNSYSNSTSNWGKSKHGNVRVVSSLENFGDENEILFGVEFELAGGWKIYHKDSTDAGLPPRFIDNGSQNLILSDWNYPTPIEFDFQGIKTLGYKGNVILPWRLKIIDNTKPVLLKGYIEYYTCNELCVVVKENVELKINGGDLKTSSHLDRILSYQQDATNLLFIILIALLSGLILNIMPCVLPVLSFKLSAITKSKNKGQMIQNSVFVSLGIISVFVILGIILIGLRSIGVGLGWGFQFQSPEFILFIIALLIIMGLNMLGVFSAQVPSKVFDYIPTGTSEKAKSFFSGIVSTLLATPCSAPLLSISMGFGILLDWYIGLLIFVFIGIGMALPYLLLIIYPNIINYFPKAGAWNNVFKNTMGVLMLLSATYFIWVNRIYYDLETQFIFAIIIGLIVYFLQIKESSRVFKAKILILFVLIGSLFSLSNKNKLDINNPNFKQFKIEKPWVKFEKNKIQNLVSNGKTVVVNITASWCITCQVNELTTFSKDDVIKVLKSEDVVAMVGDFTNNDKSILLYINKYNRFAIPFTIIYTPENKDGILLPVLLSPNDILKNIKN